MTTEHKILKMALSYLQNHERKTYENSLRKISQIIQTQITENNPVFDALLQSDLPSDLDHLHSLLSPRVIG